MKPLPLLSEIERLLLVKTSSLGDVIHALPAVQAIKEAHPELTLGWVVRRRSADVLRGCPWIDHLYILDNRPSLQALSNLRRDLMAVHYQMALDMQGLFLSGLIARLSGVPIRVGWDRNREGNALFLTHPVVPGRAAAANVQHEIDLLFGFPEALGAAVTRGEFPRQDYLAAEGYEKASAWLSGLPGPRLALNMGAARAFKRWPTEYWLRLAIRLADMGFSLVFVGDGKDSEAVADVLSAMPPGALCADISGKTTVRELAAALAQCDLVISGDTGPMHLAVAVGTPVIALFGATDPRRHGPYGSRNIVLSNPSAVAAARPTSEQGAAAMRALSPETVCAAVSAWASETKCVSS